MSTDRRVITACRGCGAIGRRIGELCVRCKGYEPNGLTGGKWVFNPRRRIKEWVETPPPPRPIPKFCGTERGYQWHRYNDPCNWPLPLDDPCGCRAAHAAHQAFRERMRNRNRRRERSAA